MDLKDNEILQATPEIHAEAEAYMAEYDRKIAEGDFVQITRPLEDFSEVKRQLDEAGVKPKPWGWWEKNTEK